MSAFSSWCGSENNLFCSSRYRFHFNGKEQESTSWLDYGFRNYSALLGRFISVDPLKDSYPSWTPFAYAMNRPIDGVDMDGLEWTDADGESQDGPYSNEYATSNKPGPYSPKMQNGKWTENVIIEAKSKATEQAEFQAQQLRYIIGSIYNPVELDPYSQLKHDLFISGKLNQPCQTCGTITQANPPPTTQELAAIGWAGLGGKVAMSRAPTPQPMPIRNLSYANIRVTHKGIAVVERHLSRFENDPGNAIMVNRLKAIASGKLQITEHDKAYYSHELREYVRYRNAGWESGQPQGKTDGLNNSFIFWQEHHYNTLKDYNIDPKNSERLLYHPETDR